MTNKEELLAISIGDKIRLLRVRKGLSQEELAFLSDIHRTYLGNLERGEKHVTVNTLNKVCIALGVSLREFFVDL